MLPFKQTLPSIPNFIIFFFNQLLNSLTLIYIYIFALNLLNLCSHLLILKYICRVLLVYIVQIIC